LVSWKTQQKAIEDKEQTQLTKKGCIPNPNKYAEKTYSTFDFSKQVLCPFCLEYNALFSFIKKRGFFECPVCHNDMMLKTLVKEMNIADFARWVYEYRLSGFWDKVYPNFESWNNKLWKLGIAKEFWENYKRLKGDNNPEELSDE